MRVDRAIVALERHGVWVGDSDRGRGWHEEAAILQLTADYVRGPFLAGFSLRDSPDFDDWRATRAVALERAVAQLLDRVADAREVEGDTDGAVAAAQRRLDLDPLDEAAHRRLMRILPSRETGRAIRQVPGASPPGARIGRLPTPETSTLYEAIRDAAPGSGCFAGLAPGRTSRCPSPRHQAACHSSVAIPSWLGCWPNTDPPRLTDG